MAKNLIVAVDIGTNTVKLAQFSINASETRLIRTSVARFPRESATGTIDAETVSRTLEALWHDVKGGKHKVILSIPRLLVTTRRLTEFPTAANDEQLSNLVSMQAESEIPFSAENAVFDYHDVRRGANGVSVELIAAKRESVQQYIDCLQSIDVVTAGIVPSAMATAALGRAFLGGQAGDRITMIADIGAGNTDICLVQGGKFVFSRSFSLGGNDLTLRYQEEVGGDFEFAEQMKMGRCGLDQESTDRIPTYKWADRLATQIDQSIGAARREIESASEIEIDEILICGGGGPVSGLPEYLTNRLGVATKRWNPLDAFSEQGGKIDTAPIGNVGGALSVALGLGVNAATHEIALDLLPREEKAKLTQSEQRRRLIYSVAAGIVLVAGIGLGGLTFSRSKQTESAILDDQIRRIAESESRAKHTLTENLATADLLSPRVSVLDILRVLSMRFSDRTKVAWTNFHVVRLDELDSAKMTFNIEAKSHGDVSEMIRVMGQSGLFANIKSGDVTSVRRDKEVYFQTQVACNLSPDAPRLLAQTRFPGTATENEDRGEKERTHSDEESTSDRSQPPETDARALAEPQDGSIVSNK
ncbi:MAG: pilus assembly protein PilM [Candidatus Poribacteria bacterium]|nr:pilus assembly protein PilM [Candidatus Poribacteria bacterium]